MNDRQPTVAVPSDREIPAEASAFEREASATLGRLQAALARLVNSVGGSALRRAADLQRAFRVDPKLAWQVHRSVNASTPLESGACLPVAAALRRFVRAAEKRGVGAPLTDAVASSIDEFETLVERHAGDRDAFDSMVSGWAGEVGAQLDLAHKKALYRSQGHMIGVSARTQFTCSVFHPADAGFFDTMVLRGFISVRRRRPDVAFPLSRVHIRPKSTEVDPEHGPWREALDPEAEAQVGSPILPQFTSQPFPRFRTRTLESMHTLVELVGDEIGNTAAATYALGDVYRRTRYPEPLAEGEGYVDRTVIPAPSETLVRDFLIHDSLVRGQPRVGVWTEVSGQGLAAPILQWRETAIRLPLRESIDALGRGPDVLTTSLVPRYEEMLRWGCERLGWKLNEFQVFRCRVQYPIPQTVLLTEFDLRPE
jgi:hypothetical protein